MIDGMKVMVHVWGDGSYHNVGSIKSEAELKELQQKIDANDYDVSDYDDSCNGDVDVEFGIAPNEAVLTVYAMKNGTTVGEKLFESNLNDLPYSCFEHEFQIDFPFHKPKVKHVWHFEQTVHGVFHWSDLPMKCGEKFDPKKLRIPVKHVLFKGEELYSMVGSPTYEPLPDEDFGGLDESEIDWGYFCRLQAL